MSTEFRSGTVISAVKLSEIKVFIAYSRDPYSDGNNYYLNGIVCTITGNTIIVGTPAQLSTLTSAGYTISTVSLNENKVFIAHSAGGSNFYLYGIVCTIDGTAITVGTDTQLSTSRSTGVIISAVSLTENKVFIAHSNSGSDSSLYGIVCTISDTNITIGTDTFLNSTYGMAISTVKLNENKVFIAYTKGNSRYLSGRVCTISGTTITKGTDTQLTTIDYSGHTISAITLTENKVFIAHNSDNTNNFLNGLVCVIDEMAITIGVDTQLSNATNSGKIITTIKLNSNRILIIHSTTNNYYLNKTDCIISGTTIRKVLEHQLSDVTDSGKTISGIVLSENKIFIAHSGSTSLLYGIGENVDLIEKTTSLFEINGIAKTSATAGNIAQIYVPN